MLWHSIGMVQNKHSRTQYIDNQSNIRSAGTVGIVLICYPRRCEAPGCFVVTGYCMIMVVTGRRYMGLLYFAKSFESTNEGVESAQK